MNRILVVVAVYALSMAALVAAASMTVSALSTTGRGLIP